MPEYPTSLNAETLDAFLTQRPHSVIHLDAKWDAYGYMLQRRIQEIAGAHRESTSFGFIDVDDNQEQARSLKVGNVPACAYFRGCEHVTTITGLNQDIETNLFILMRGDKPDGSARIKLD
ncbi:MAG: thioredoxin domain-containing protein [Verrucomicrobiota bacterium]